MKRVLAFVLVVAMIATLASFPTFAAENISLSATNLITAPAGGTGDLANLFDADEATGYLVGYNYSWGGGADSLTSNNVFEIDLGAIYDNPEVTLNWGGQGTHGWGWTTPNDYTVYYAGEDKAYTESVKYTDLFDKVDGGLDLPEGFTASRAYSDEYILTAVTSIAAEGVRYIKVEMNSFKDSGIALNDISAKGTFVSEATGGGTTPPPAGGGNDDDTPITGDENKIILIADNVVAQRYFPESGWAGNDSDLTANIGLLVDGDYGTYAYSGVWGGPTDVLTAQGFSYQIIVDLGVEKNLSKIDFHVGAENYGNGWQFAAPLNPEILVAGEDGVYTSVFTYEATGNDDYRLDSVTLDPSTNGRGVRYVKYAFTNIYANVAIAEIEITEITAAEPTTYTVEYIDQNGDPVIDAKVVEGFLTGDIVTENAPVVEGYDNINTTESITLVENATDNVITFEYFKKTSATYTVNYVDANGSPIADAKTVSTGVYVDDEITEYAASVAGYVVTGSSSATITLVDGENTITFTYDVYVSISGEHSVLDHLTGEALVETDISLDSISDADRLFDGDASASHEDIEPAQTPNGNGIFGAGWDNSSDVRYLIFDLGDIYELSQIDTYWGWAPQAHPTWNSWQYDVPSSYTIYVADTLEDLANVAPAAIVTGLAKDPDTFLCASSANLATWGRFVKVVVNPTGGQFALREITFTGAEFINPSNNTTVKVEYKDENGNTIAPAIEITKTTGKIFDVEPITIPGYSAISTTQTVTFDTNKSVTVVYRAIPTVEVAPAEDGTYSEGVKEIPFVFTVATPDNVAPDAFAVANWIATNCEIKDVKVEADGMLGFVYAWKVIVTVAPAEGKAFSVELDLPDTFELTDKVSITRAPSASTLDSAIMVGENSVVVSTNKVVIELESNGMVKTDKSKRKVHVTLNLQSVNEALLPYNGYDKVTIELKEIKSAGQGFSYKAVNFVKLDGCYVGELLAHKYGADQLSFVIALYGVNADGTKVELDTAVVRSEILEVVPPETKPAPTVAENISWKILPIDILTQLIDQVHPNALPEITDADWDIYREVAEIRASGLDIDALRATYDEYRASEPTGEYTDNLVIDVNKQIQGSVYLWNFLKDIKVETITFTNLAVTQITEEGIEAVGDIVNVDVTFRRGIDYDYLNVLNGGDFNLRIRINIDDSEEKSNLIGKAYNAVRRALNDEQAMPLFFRLDWYTWANLPFTGAVFNVTVSDKWVDNNGAFNIVAYHLKPYTYDYEKDNTPTIEKVESDLTISPITNKISFAVDGGSNGSQIYDTYVIVSTNKLPSELPATIN